MSERNALVLVPRAFRLAMGTLVFEFAALETVVSEVITGKHRNAVPNRGWAQSGVQLIEEFRACFPADALFRSLGDELADLSEWRNMYIHSEWFFYDDHSAALMKRAHRKNSNYPVTFHIHQRVELADLDRFTERTRKLSEDLLPFVLKAMDGHYERG